MFVLSGDITFISSFFLSERVLVESDEQLGFEPEHYRIHLKTKYNFGIKSLKDMNEKHVFPDWTRNQYEWDREKESLMRKFPTASKFWLRLCR